MNYETNLLNKALSEVYAQLQIYAQKDYFFNILEQVFGNNFDLSKAEKIRLQWQLGDFSLLPVIQVISSSTLNTTLGAYATTTNQIYLSENWLSNSQPGAIANVLLEEIGHWLDTQINSVDTPGDEGELFSALIRGKILSESELQRITSEDDTAVITINGQTIQVEQATVSDSGGFEGSQQTIKLESTGGGTARFSYQHFSIPDQFIIRYEGKELLNTGFVGGSRSGQVSIPQGTSDILEVIVATDDEGTAWNYTVTTDPCPDTGTFLLQLIGGEFQYTDDGTCKGEGTIYIGRKDGISQMLRVEGRVEYTDKTISVDGTIFSVIGAGSVTTNPLFQGKFEINISNGTVSSFQETGSLSNEYQLGGLDVDFSALTINSNGLALGAKFQLLEEIGFPEIFFSGSDALLISQNNVTFGPSVKFSLPTFENFNFFNFLPIKKFSDFAIEYVAPEDKITIQGKLVIDDFTRTEKLGTITADLSGDNAIEIQGGEADIKGSLTVETDIKLIKGWSLKEFKLDIDTKNKEVGGSTKVEFPFKAKIPPGSEAEAGVGLGFKIPIPPLDLNKVSIDVDQLNVPIPNFPLVFFQRFAGSVENLAKSDPDPIEFGGGVGATLGPQFDLALSIPSLGVDIRKENIRLIRLDLDGKVSSEELSGEGKIVILDDIIATASGTSTLNWNKKFYETKGEFSILDGLIRTNSGFKVNSGFDINMSGRASVGIPNFIPLFGGAQIAGGNFLLDFSNDSNLANDFAAGWGSLNIQKLGFEINAVLGFKVYFDGRFERIGSKNIPPVGSYAIEPDTEWIFLGADWENPVIGDVPIQIELPDGSIIDEADFAANNIAIVEELSDSTTKVVVVFNPQPGIWDIKIVDETGLGEVRYTAATDSFLPSIDITSPTTDVSGGLVTINYNAFDPDSDAQIKLFYDTDNQDFDGILITDDLVENDGFGSFLWNTEGIPTGDYYIYGMILDENNPPTFSYSPGRVQIAEEADLSVTKTANLDSVIAGSNLTYTVTVTNNGVFDAKNVFLTEALPVGATVITTTESPTQQTGNILTFELGDLAPEASKTFEITVSVPNTPGIISATAAVSSPTFDPDFTNDVESLSTTVTPIPPTFSDLIIVRTNNEDSVNLGQQYTYTLTVTNNGPNNATEVVLTENLASGLNFNGRTLSQGSAFFSSFNQRLTANLGNIASGQQATVNITVTPFTTGDLITTSSVTSNQTDPNPTNNELINAKVVSTTVPSPADLELTKTVNNPNPDVGDEITFNLTLSNKGPGSAVGIEVQNLLPQKLSFISAFPEQGTYNPDTGLWDVGNIRDNLSRTLRITALVNSPGKIVNTSEIIDVQESDPDSTPGNNNPDEDDQVSITLLVGRSRFFSSFNPLSSFNQLLTDNLGNIGSGQQATVNIPVTPFTTGDLITTLVNFISGRPDSETLTGTDSSDYIDGKEGRDLLLGGKGDDVIVGGVGADLITGGEGNNSFVYTSLRDIGDRITDFNVNDDKIVFTELLDSLGYSGASAIADGYVRWVQGASGTSVQIDSDGSNGPGIFQPFILLENLSANTLSPNNFVF
ncbi:type I secretion C-terminal target domain-containing protein [Nodularia spumigena CS-586/05]|nr:type I secretion C-terminal target domain-containing protein [Nodularia spumigena]MDB9343550.1 type I secretion C-terminal target domain-containing protein [Nodularia spumigena CS-588/06]MDB9369021.1 type I secretion C-terminal target domain-containing protein [Nodularia spumigena CS-586/05]